MVLLHFKNSETDQFLFETSVALPARDVSRDLADVHNLRHRITRLKLEGGELAKYGPAKAPDRQGIDKFEEGHEARERGPHYCMDPTGRRSGEACDPEVAQKLLKELDDAEAAASKDRVLRKEPLTKAALLAAIDNIRGAVMICYPMGLPEWDFVRQCLEGREDLSGSDFGGKDLDPETCQLWFASRALAADRPLSDALGRNERTRAVVKATKKGAGAPAREPAVDADTQKAMLAWYYKKQEQQKAGGPAG
ncbi:putative Uncharacterized protein C21orf59 like protein [Monoraphidium neglectum]|uniref:Uncharacterized protein n=1 Tax=Monoraphidium neglectum TaxID=145388 RepID=A0A0D2NAU8_9CHLO|nr:putative Uncharacterized protein C21orf59 like protein [Monoraphidium neglectum]KIZ02636.1 putative Uncharacterized protein C21orf59 like protein [Monoraphidium neglectum]|eukprot:XP_013901655.1 putative Uncharacterized protein C21orf59 like protein [Monoraphidium neglectum]